MWIDWPLPSTSEQWKYSKIILNVYINFNFINRRISIGDRSDQNVFYMWNRNEIEMRSNWIPDGYIWGILFRSEPHVIWCTHIHNNNKTRHSFYFIDSLPTNIRFSHSRTMQPFYPFWQRGRNSISMCFILVVVHNKRYAHVSIRIKYKVFVAWNSFRVDFFFNRIQVDFIWKLQLFFLFISPVWRFILPDTARLKRLWQKCDRQIDRITLYRFNIYT